VILDFEIKKLIILSFLQYLTIGVIAIFLFSSKSSIRGNDEI